MILRMGFVIMKQTSLWEKEDLSAEIEELADVTCCGGEQDLI
jgi:hypothetical protein